MSVGKRGALLLGLLLACGLAFACASKEERVAKHLQRASQYEKAGDERAALVELKSALKADPQNANVNFRLAEILEQGKRYHDALFYYREAARLDPSNEDARLGEASLLLHSNRKDREKAEKIIREVAKRDPKNFLAHVRLSEVALLKADTKQALEEALTATQLSPHSLRAHLQVGLVYQATIRDKELHKETAPDSLYQSALKAFQQVSSAEGKAGDAPLQARAALERARVFWTWPGHEKDADAAFRQAFQRTQALHLPPERVLLSALRFAAAKNQPATRIWALEKTVELQPDDMRSWELLARAKDPVTVPHSSVLEKLIQQRPKDARAQAVYARDLALRGDRKDAIDHLEKVLDQVDKKEVIRTTLVDLDLAQGDVDAARKQLAALQAEAQGSPQLYYATAMIARHDHDLDSAADALQKLVSLEDTRGAERMLAEVQLLRGQTAPALTAVNRALELSRGEPRGINRLLSLRARIEERSGNHYAAIRTYNRVRRRTHGRLGVDDLPPLAEALYATGQAEAGKKVLETALALQDPPVSALVLFARHELKQDPEQVKSALDHALTLHPHEVALVRARAQVDLAEGNAKAAEQRLRSAIASVQDSAPLRTLLVDVLLRSHHPQEALKEARELMKVAPGDPNAARVLAATLIRAGKTDEARKELEARRAKGSLDAPGQVLLARLDMIAGKDDDAIKLLESAVHDRGDFIGAKNDLAFLLAKQGRDLDRALQLAQDARQKAPSLSATADTLGFVYLKRGLPEAALSQLENALQLAQPGSPEWATAEYHRGLALQALKRPAEARTAFQKALAHEFPEAAAARAALQSLGPATS